MAAYTVDLPSISTTHYRANSQQGRTDVYLELTFKSTYTDADNSSVLYWYLYARGQAAGFVSVSASNINVNINGQPVCTNLWSGAFGAALCISNGKIENIKHTGTSVVTLPVTITSTISGDACNATGNVTLPHPGYSPKGLKASTVYLGKNCNIAFTSSSTEQEYEFEFSYGNWKKSTDRFKLPAEQINKEYTYTGFTIPLDVLANMIPNSTTVIISTKLNVYYNNTLFSIHSIHFNANLPNTVIPTITDYVVSPVNDSSSKIPNSDLYLSGSTKAKLTATAKGVYGSTIQSIELSGTYITSLTSLDAGSYTQSGNDAKLNYTGGVLNSNGSLTFTIVAKDSRGRRSTPSDVSVDVLKYSQPRILEFSVSRNTQQQKPGQAIIKSLWEFNDYDAQNSATATLEYKQISATEWTKYNGTINNGTTILSESISFKEGSSYNFKLTIKDDFGGVVVQEALLTTAYVLLDFLAEGLGLGIGRMVETQALEVGLDAHFYGGVYIHEGSNPKPLKEYIRQIVSEVLAGS